MNIQIIEISPGSESIKPILRIEGLTRKQLESIINKAIMWDDMHNQMAELNTNLETGKEIPF